MSTAYAPAQTVEDRLNSRTIVQDGHLMWCGGLAVYDYGQLKVGRKVMAAHRLAWEIAYGPIPEGAHALHLCDTPPCIEPTHLYLGTPADNTWDKVRAGHHHNTNKTHCPRGHAYDEENTYHYPDGRRDCCACHRRVSREWMRKARAK